MSVSKLMVRPSFTARVVAECKKTKTKLAIHLEKSGKLSLVFGILHQSDDLRIAGRNKVVRVTHQDVTIYASTGPGMYRSAFGLVVDLCGTDKRNDNNYSTVTFLSSEVRDQHFKMVLEAFDVFAKRGYFKNATTPEPKPDPATTVFYF